MTKGATDKVTEILTSPVFKAIGAAFVLGFGVHQFEAKFDEFGNRVIKKIDEHIMADGFEKQAMNKEISELKITIKNMQEDAKEYFKTEFVRPDEVRIEPSKRNRR